MKVKLAIVLAAVAAFLVPLSPSFVEQYYSQAFFPSLQAVVTTTSNLTPVACLDLLAGLVLLVVTVITVRDARRYSALRAGSRLVFRLVTIGAVVYLAFVIVWGMNYRREPLRHRVTFDAGRVTPAAALELARTTVTALNATYADAHAEGWTDVHQVDPTLVQAFRRTTRRLGLAGGTVPGRPKWSVFDLYFRRAGVAGMTDPLLLETLVAGDLLPFERPLVIAHEWSHLAGVTDEGEANFAGWLACQDGSTAHHYSGWLFLYGELLRALPAADARTVSTALASGPRADLDAIRQRDSVEISPRLAYAGWQAYDQYLKANHIEAGAASYGEVVQLILGTGLR